MNRVIKFRAWDRKQMTDIICIAGNGNACTWDDSDDAFQLRLTSVKWPIMQFTGLTDKNGVEIYEGDILSLDRRLYEVKASIGGYDLVKYRLWRGKFKPSFTYLLSLITDGKGKVKDAEIIGNIFEHPELLTEKAK